MCPVEPPRWGPDLLSKYLHETELNTRITAANLPHIFSLLKELDEAFRTAERAIESDTKHLLPRFLFVRVHSACLAASRLGMGGQAPEAHAVLRTGVELGWYALHIAKDPEGSLRERTWLERNDNEECTRRCKTEFTIARVRSTHEGLDARTAADLRAVYDTLIDFGGHPNPLGTLGMVRPTAAKRQGERAYDVGILRADHLQMRFVLRNVVAVGVGALKILNLIYPEPFARGDLGSLGLIGWLKGSTAVLRPDRAGRRACPQPGPTGPGRPSFRPLAERWKGLHS
jgi:hypothetical protein